MTENNQGTIINLAIVIGSTRPERVSHRMGMWLKTVCDNNPGVHTEILDLAKYNLPFFNENKPPQNNDDRQLEANVAQWLADLAKADGVILFDDGNKFQYPMPVNSEGKDECFAGRIRKDSALSNAITMWICGDQLLKGAALNAVQIAEFLIRR